MLRKRSVWADLQSDGVTPSNAVPRYLELNLGRRLRPGRREPMKHWLRAALLIASAFLMVIGAVGYALIVVPDLHGDLIEIGVRPTVLGGTVLHLYFAGLAMFGFALMVSLAAIQAIRGVALARLPLAVVAVIYTAFGAMAFSRSHSPHHLGPLAAGVLLGAALTIVSSKPRRAESI
jgi:hypothetical protein